MSFSDYSTLQYQSSSIKSYLDKFQKGLLGTADGWNITREINAYVLQFFDQYLKKIPSKNLNSCTAIAKDSMLTCQNTL